MVGIGPSWQGMPERPAVLPHTWQRHPGPLIAQSEHVRGNNQGLPFIESV
ncbi:hypothetical protein GCM10023323_26760 [Streptomyces thinghirensis]|uniref:Uncharacterized protein n=1 Tax=Streptomyces thinghirensis TaxID=551547 RepID=A0ABP9T4S4_9ACTN